MDGAGVACCGCLGGATISLWNLKFAHVLLKHWVWLGLGLMIKAFKLWQGCRHYPDHSWNAEKPLVMKGSADPAPNRRCHPFRETLLNRRRNSSSRSMRARVSPLNEEMPETECMLVATWAKSLVWKWFTVTKALASAPFYSSRYWVPSNKSFIENVSVCRWPGNHLWITGGTAREADPLEV